MRKNDNLSLLNGLSLLLLYNPSTLLLTIREISKKLAYSQSKTYRLVKTLTNHGFLQKKPGTKQYALGLNILRLGLTAQQNLALSVIARPFMEELSSLTKESVFLSIVNGRKRMLIEKVESDEPVRYSEDPRKKEIRNTGCDHLDVVVPGKGNGYLAGRIQCRLDNLVFRGEFPRAGVRNTPGTGR